MCSCEMRKVDELWVESMLNESGFKSWVQSTENLLWNPEMYYFSLAFLCYKSSGTLICGNFSMLYDCFLLLDRWETLQQKKNGKRRISMKYLSWPAWKAMAQRWAFFLRQSYFLIGYNFYGRSGAPVMTLFWSIKWKILLITYDDLLKQEPLLLKRWFFLPIILIVRGFLIIVDWLWAGQGRWICVLMFTLFVIRLCISSMGLSIRSWFPMIFIGCFASNINISFPLVLHAQR